MTHSPLLQASRLTFAYHNQPVLDGINVSLAPGEIVCLLGCNGAGKSTLLRLLLGLISPSQGEIHLGGQALNQYSRPQLARLLAYVPQCHQPPFPYPSEQVVMLGRLPHGHLLKSPSPADSEVVHTAMSRLGISHLRHRPYTELSGGERQLVLIARAMAQGARLILMDEPVNGLDYGNQYRLLGTLRRLAAEGYGILLTTHHPEHVLFCASRALLMQGGRIIADGAPEQVLEPALLAQLYGIQVNRHRLDDGHWVLQPRVPAH